MNPLSGSLHATTNSVDCWKILHVLLDIARRGMLFTNDHCIYMKINAFVRRGTVSVGPVSLLSSDLSLMLVVHDVPATCTVFSCSLRADKCSPLKLTLLYDIAISTCLHLLMLLVLVVSIDWEAVLL